MNPAQFIAKWQKAELGERQAAQQHFLDLCELVGHPKPAEADPAGEWFTFEKGAARHGSGTSRQGWADVWKRGCFAWEYKGRHKDLGAAYDQLLQYREALENPPLLVVCDLELIVVRTNFTATATAVHELALAELGSPRNLEILHALFHAPAKLKPGATSEAVTTEAARRIGEIALALRARGCDPQAVAPFLDRVVFCFFAEDIGLLPAGLFTSLLEKTRPEPARFARLAGQLFEAMAGGGDFGLETIRRFNGGLFASAEALELEEEELASLAAAGRLDWSAVDPSIFGTLFVRGLDPAQRAQLGAQYTSREDIETLVDPVVLAPLRREWEEAKQVCDSLLATGRKIPGMDGSPSRPPPGLRSANAPYQKKARGEATSVVHRFLIRLSQVKVLDPACGSGNFLYVTLQKLKDLEKEAIVYAMERGLGSFLPMVGPWQLHGIEVSPYAHELAQMTVWIGYLQWTRANGFGVTQEPILRPMDRNFLLMDAILDLTDPEQPREPEWPAVDFIVGNPPFLGGKKLRAELGDGYVERLFALWKGRVPAEADLCAYWFEKARAMIAEARCGRAGLLATQGIRGGANRKVLERIKETGDIFFAESDRQWILDGAAVHVSMVGFDAGIASDRVLDGQPVAAIHANLGAAADVASARRLAGNVGLAFMGDTKGGPFDLSEEAARPMLTEPTPHGRPNADVVVPWTNGLDVTRRPRGVWIVDFGERGEAEAAAYEAPFEHARTYVLPQRAGNARETYRHLWWRHVEARPGMRAALAPLPRFLATTTVSKHRLFVWMEAPTLPDHQLIVFARSDDAFFGLLHSRIHEVWALRLGTQLESRPRYTPTTCFETFPFPEGIVRGGAPSGPYREAIAEDRRSGLAPARALGPPGSAGQAPPYAAVADAARELDELRRRWLDPPEWTREEVLEFPGSADGPWRRYVRDPDARGIGTVRYPRHVPVGAEAAARLKKRTLTNLYNQRPAWLDLAHRKLDEAVFAAYGWDPGLSDEAILEKLLALNRERSGFL
ncbi:MAG: DNA methyltransferase [Thermodesulfobacteriota bacterium]